MLRSREFVHKYTAQKNVLITTWGLVRVDPLASDLGEEHLDEVHRVNTRGLRMASDTYVVKSMNQELMKSSMQLAALIWGSELRMMVIKIMATPDARKTSVSSTETTLASAPPRGYDEDDQNDQELTANDETSMVAPVQQEYSAGY
jgi:hypothetical protein